MRINYSRRNGWQNIMSTMSMAPRSSLNWNTHNIHFIIDGGYWKRGDGSDEQRRNGDDCLGEMHCD